MKNHLYPYFLIIIFLFTSCQKDFNPESDSSVRDVTFCVQTDNCFAHILVQDGTDYYLGAEQVLPDNVFMRITGYCYDQDEQLIRRFVSTEDCIQETTITFHKLDTCQTYSFLFLMEFVRKNELDGIVCYWNHLAEQTRSSFYLSCHEDVDDWLLNSVLFARWQGQPSVVKHNISVEPCTVNGYLRLVNISQLDQVYVQAAYSRSFYLWDLTTLTSKRYYTHPKTFSPFTNLKEMVIPVCYSSVNKSIGIKVKTRIVSTMDSIVSNISNAHHPFVCTIDCANKEIIDTRFY